jgi:hypothetical protein
MPVSSLVLTTEIEFSKQQAMALEQDPRITVGVAQGCYLPVVTDARDLREARDLAEALLLAPGVLDAQLVSWTDDDSVFPEGEA